MKREIIIHGLMVVAALVAMALIYLVFAKPAHAVQPDEMLSNPQLEARAREISADLRCLVCQSESIDNSNAELAKTLRLLVRERLLEGDTNQEVIDYIVARYGEFVLLKPVIALHTLALWLAGPFALLVGGFLAWRYLRNISDGGDEQGGYQGNDAQESEKNDIASPTSLNKEEQEKLAKLLGD